MFDDSFRDSLLKRGEGRPAWHRPEIWLVATAEERHAQRVWLNRAIDALPEPGRSKVMARLPENPHFLSTYIELATAAVLLDAGMSLDYERDFDGKTPDLVVVEESGPSLLIEVYTKFRSNDRREAEHSWRMLQNRVQAIPVPVVLIISNLGGTVSEAPNDAKAKRIAVELRRWLLELSGSASNRRVIQGYQFTIMGPAPGLYATMARPGGGGWFDSDMVLAAINQKVKAYAKLADRLELPLLVVLAAEPASPLSEDLVRSALKGDMSTTLSIDVFAGKSEPHTVAMRSDRTPASFAPALSAVGWMNPGIDDPGTLNLFPVPDARRPIEMSSVGGLRVGQP